MYRGSINAVKKTWRGSVGCEGSGKRPDDSSHFSLGSYYNGSESDSNESALGPMEEDTVTDRDETDSNSTYSNTEGDDSKEESVEYDI